MEVHESVNNILIPLENIDYVGPLERKHHTDWCYMIHLKSGSSISISYDGVLSFAKDDRKKLIEKLKNYIPKDK